MSEALGSIVQWVVDREAGIVLFVLTVLWFAVLGICCSDTELSRDPGGWFRRRFTRADQKGDDT